MERSILVGCLCRHWRIKVVVPSAPKWEADCQVKLTFLHFCYGVLLVLLYTIYVGGTAIVYWTPMRTTLDLPFTISPVEWTAVYAYLAAIALVAAGIYFYPPARLKHLWLGTALCAIIFATSGWAIENTFYFNAHEAEKQEGGIIIIGCGVIFICCGALTSLFWKVRSRLLEH